MRFFCGYATMISIIRHKRVLRMEISKCMGCMSEFRGYPCPDCGYDPAKQQEQGFSLAPETILGGKYLVGRVLGQGGFGITYIGWDIALERKVAIKEYYPSGQVSRVPGTRALIWSKSEQARSARQDGMQMFLKEARKMAKLEDIPGVVKVRELFQENETAYIVMDFVEGQTLKSILQKNGPIPWNQVKPIFLSAIRAMEKVHGAGLVHRDLSPDNLMITTDGNLRILDLGAAKDLNINSGASSMQVAKGGFSPLEQYTQRGGSGTWTDVYAMAATIYYTLTGKLPPNAVDRLEEDTICWDYPGLLALPAPALEALKQAMIVPAKKRTQTMAELEKGLFAQEPKPEPPKPEPPKPEPPKPEPPKPEPPKPEPPKPEPTPKKPLPKWLIPAVAAVVLVAGIGIWAKVIKPANDYKAAQSLMDSGEYAKAAEAFEALGDYEDSARKAKDARQREAYQNAVVLLDAGEYVKAAEAFEALGTYRDSADKLAGLMGNVSCTYEPNDTGLTLTGFDGDYPAEVVLPTIIDGKPVTEIGYEAFKKCNMKSVIIPGSVTKIGWQPFIDCTNLTSISIPDGVTEIGPGAFYECTSLVSVTIPDSVVEICSSAFSETPWLESQTEEFVITDNGILLAYNGNSSHVEIPNTVRIISGGFSFNKGLTSVTIPNSVTRICEDAFSYCTELTSITIPGSVTVIGPGAFEKCENLSKVTISNGVKEIGHNAFWNCTSLTSITIPDSVLEIGNQAFVDCRNLTSVTIPDGFAKIGSGVFDYTPWLESLTEEFVIRGDGVLLKYNGNASNVVIPAGVKTISNAFYGNESLSRVTIPDSVTEIGGDAFFRCANLTSVNIPDSVTTIGAWAFGDCTSLTSVNIPDSVSYIGYRTFAWCESLTSISIPDGVTYIDSEAFRGCKNLTTVSVPDSVTYIGYGAFEGCERLTTISIPDGVTYIGEEAFKDCTSLTTVSIPKNCKLGEDAFPGGCNVTRR